MKSDNLRLAETIFGPDSIEVKNMRQAEEKNLTDSEKNLLKDILKVLGNDDTLNQDIATAVGMNSSEMVFDKYNLMLDEIFAKLQNGRLIVEGN